MTDYRSFVEFSLADLESNLADIDRRREELKDKRQKFITALGVMDEADASDGGATARPEETTTPSPPPVTSAIVNILTSSGRMMTADEIHDILLRDHKVSRDLLHSGLHRLKKRGKAFKDGKKWGLAGRDDKTVASAATDQEFTNPTRASDVPSFRTDPSRPTFTAIATARASRHGPYRGRMLPRRRRPASS